MTSVKAESGNTKGGVYILECPWNETKWADLIFTSLYEKIIFQKMFYLLSGRKIQTLGFRREPGRCFTHRTCTGNGGTDFFAERKKDPGGKLLHFEVKIRRRDHGSSFETKQKADTLRKAVFFKKGANQGGKCFSE